MESARDGLHAEPDGQAGSAAELAVIIPTFNERSNVAPLYERLRTALAGIRWEAIFVDDDSPDGTAEVVRALGRTDARIRCLQRIGRKGLSSACIEGMLATSTPYLAVMDADLQHDETLLPEMFRRLSAGDLDIVVGSRFVDGGSIGEFSRHRAAISRLGARLSEFVSKARLSDPMSGFFMLRREVLDQNVRRLSGRGFKILLDLFASSPTPLLFAELGYRFRTRTAGESKLDAGVALSFLVQLVENMVFNRLPVRFVMYLLVGAVGAGLHLAVLGVLHYLGGWTFGQAQMAGIVAAMTSNFLLNNRLTYADSRLRGWRMLAGLVSYYLACTMGGIANYAVAEQVFRMDVPWLLAGGLGAAIGAVWNFSVSAVITWNIFRRSRLNT